MKKNPIPDIDRDVLRVLGFDGDVPDDPAEVRELQQRLAQKRTITPLPQLDPASLRYTDAVMERLMDLNFFDMVDSPIQRRRRKGEKLTAAQWQASRDRLEELHMGMVHSVGVQQAAEILWCSTQNVRKLGKYGSLELAAPSPIATASGKPNQQRWTLASIANYLAIPLPPE